MLKIGSNSSNYAKHNAICQYSTARARRRLAHGSNRSELHKLTKKNFTVASTCKRIDKFFLVFFLTLSCYILVTDSYFHSPDFLRDTSFPLTDRLRSDSLFFFFNLTLLLYHHHFEDLIPVLICQRICLFCPALHSNFQCVFT